MTSLGARPVVNMAETPPETAEPLIAAARDRTEKMRPRVPGLESRSGNPVGPVAMAAAKELAAVDAALEQPSSTLLEPRELSNVVDFAPLRSLGSSPNETTARTLHTRNTYPSERARTVLGPGSQSSLSSLQARRRPLHHPASPTTPPAALRVAPLRMHETPPPSCRGSRARTRRRGARSSRSSR